MLVAQVAGEGAVLSARGVSGNHRPGVGATVGGVMVVVR